MENHQNVYYFLEKGQKLLDQENYIEAIKIYQEALTLYPKNATIYRNLGFAQEKVGDTDGEIISYQKAIEFDHQQPIWVYTTLAELLKKQKQFQDTLKVYQKASKIEPKNSLFYREIGVIQEKLGDFIGQLNNYQKAIDLEENQPVWVYLVLGKLLRENKDFYAAISIYQKAITLYPQFAELYRELGFTQEKIADFEGEKFNYQKAIELNPNQPIWVYTTLGNFYQNEENWTEVIILYQQGIKFYPSLKSFLDKISPENWQNEIALLENHLNLQPDQANLYIKLGQLYEYLNPQKAIENYQKAQLKDSKNINSYLNLAHILIEQHQLEAAIDNYKNAQKLANSEKDQQILTILKEKIFNNFNYLEIIKETYKKIISIYEILEKETELEQILTKLKQEISEFYGFNREELPDKYEKLTVGKNLTIETKIGLWENWLKKMQLINNSVIFNLEFYVTNNQIEKGEKTRLKIISDYLESGYLENTHPLFNAYYYLNQEPKLLEKNLNPLIHFLEIGWQKGRKPHPLFDPIYYLKNNPEININPLEHFLEKGVWEGKNPHPLFNTSYYLKNNPELKQLKINPLEHFLEKGVWEEKNPHPLFNTSYYLKNNPELIRIGINSLQHFLEIGGLKQKNSHPLFSLKNYQDYLQSINQSLKPEQNPLIFYLQNDDDYSRFVCFPWQSDNYSIFDQKGYYDILIFVDNNPLFLDLIPQIRHQNTDINLWIVILKDQNLVTECSKHGLTFFLSENSPPSVSQNLREILTSFHKFTTSSLVIFNHSPEIDNLCQKHQLPSIDLYSEILKNNKNKPVNQEYSLNNTFIIKNKAVIIQSTIDQLNKICNNSNSKELKVSVIIPNYNSEKFIKQRLETVINQTEKPGEIIFLDDKSLDNSLEIAEKMLQDSKITYQIILNEKNSGSPFKQWVKGIEKATGDLIWIAESDDFCNTRLLKKLKEQFSDSDVVLAYCQSKPVNLEGEILAPNYLFYTDEIDKNKWKNNYKNEGIKEIKDFLSIKNTIPNASAVLIRKSAISEETLLNIQKYRFAGDWLMYLSLLTQGKIAFIAQPLNYHRQHKQTVTQQIQRENSHIQEILEVKKYINKLTLKI